MPNKITVIFLFAILAAGIAAPCYPQEDQAVTRVTKSSEGTIFDLDWAGSKMTIRGPDASGSNFHELVLNVPNDAIIRKGSGQIDFSELQIDDDVTVTYYENSDGTGTLISLEDTTSSP